MRKILTLILATTFSLSMWAAGYSTVCVNLTDGSQVKIMMAESLKLTFNQNELVATGSDSDVTVPKANIVNFTHLSESGVDGVESGPDYTFVNGVMEFSNLPSQSVIAVYDQSGRTMLREVAEGYYTLSLNRFSKGVYVVTVNNVSYKIINK